MAMQATAFNYSFHFFGALVIGETALNSILSFWLICRPHGMETPRSAYFFDFFQKKWHYLQAFFSHEGPCLQPHATPRSVRQRRQNMSMLPVRRLCCMKSGSQQAKTQATRKPNANPTWSVRFNKTYRPFSKARREFNTNQPT